MLAQAPAPTGESSDIKSYPFPPSICILHPIDEPSFRPFPFHVQLDEQCNQCHLISTSSRLNRRKLKTSLHHNDRRRARNQGINRLISIFLFPTSTASPEVADPHHRVLLATTPILQLYLLTIQLTSANAFSKVKTKSQRKQNTTTQQLQQQQHTRCRP